mmetsp:Transcript_139288/g.445316  ORF Transcript_139288/g.445316 Transcript_139288/m.445316 type:complete len:218 (+) Transcript_139288:245-898(+)
MPNLGLETFPRLGVHKLHIFSQLLPFALDVVDVDCAARSEKSPAHNNFQVSEKQVLVMIEDDGVEVGDAVLGLQRVKQQIQVLIRAEREWQKLDVHTCGCMAHDPLRSFEPLLVLLRADDCAALSLLQGSHGTQRTVASVASHLKNNSRARFGKAVANRNLDQIALLLAQVHAQAMALAESHESIEGGPDVAGRGVRNDMMGELRRGILRGGLRGQQ